MGIHWTGIVFGLGAIISMGYWTTDFLVVQRIPRQRICVARRLRANHRRRIQDVRSDHRDSAGAAGIRPAPDQIGSGIGRR